MHTKREEATIAAFKCRLCGLNGGLVQIKEVHEHDAFYEHKASLLGEYALRVRTRDQLPRGESRGGPDWYKGELKVLTGPYNSLIHSEKENPHDTLYFIEVRCERV